MTIAVREVFTFTAAAQTGVLGPASDATAGDITIQVTGTFTMTITVEAKVPGSPDADYTAIQATRLSDGVAGSTITAPDIYRINATGLDCRLNVTAFTSGTASVRRKPTIG